MSPSQDRSARPNRPTPRELYRRTIVRLLLTYVAPIILLTVYFLVQSSNLTRESRRTHLRSLAEHEAQILDLFLRERVVNLNNLIDNPNLGVKPCQELAEAFLAELQRNSDAFVDIGFFDESGVQTCYVGPYPSLERRDYSSESWYEALRTDPGRHIITDSYLGFRGRPHFTIAVSRVIGGRFEALRATLDPEKIYEHIVAAVGASDVHVSIVNATGHYQIVTPHIGASLDESSVVPPRDPRIGIAQVSVKGKSHDIGYTWLQTSDWALITQLRGASHGGLLDRNLRETALIAAAIILIITVVIVFRARSIVHIQEETVETKKQLVHASKLASVGELAAGIAHEINNPLAIISEEAGLMKDMMDPKFGVEYTEGQLIERLNEIHKAVFRCRDITRKLLAFVRSDGVKLGAHRLNDLVNDVLDGFFEREMATSDIEVVRRLDEKLDPVLTDAMQLEQVLINIINNAIDAMGGRPGSLTVETSQDEQYQHVAITDTGTGMDEYTMSRIFQPFFTTKEVREGTGLGLSVSYGIVESLGGKIAVESAVGTGSTFTISLPRSGG